MLPDMATIPKEWLLKKGILEIHLQQMVTKIKLLQIANPKEVHPSQARFPTGLRREVLLMISFRTRVIHRVYNRRITSMRPTTISLPSAVSRKFQELPDAVDQNLMRVVKSLRKTSNLPRLSMKRIIAARLLRLRKTRFSKSLVKEMILKKRN